jgi:imidazoleglycerol phosphate synthase glutamine amidotransferase subunit HisH
MQLLFDASEENGTTCLGLIPGQVRAGRSGHPRAAAHGLECVQRERDDPLLSGMARRAGLFRAQLCGADWRVHAGVGDAW